MRMVLWDKRERRLISFREMLILRSVMNRRPAAVAKSGIVILSALWRRYNRGGRHDLPPGALMQHSNTFGAGIVTQYPMGNPVYAAGRGRAILLRAWMDMGVTLSINTLTRGERG